MTILHRIIHFPKPEEMEEAGAGFVCLAGCDSFLLQRATEEMLHKQKTLDLTAAAGHLRCQGAHFWMFTLAIQDLHTVLMSSADVPIYKQALYPPAGCFLLGDAG